MRSVIQRVTKANVVVNEKIIGEIENGLMVLIGAEKSDTIEDVEWTVDKILNLRIFEDDNQKMNLSLLDVKGKILAISQFTLLGDARKGRRPSFTNAENPEKALYFYNKFVELASKKVNVQQGEFGAHMKVNLTNNGPVTILIDSRKNF